MLQAYQSSADYGDFDIVESLFDPHMINALRAEAYALMHEAIDSCFTMDDADEWQGGSPARSFQSAPGGELQTAFFHAPEMIRFINQWSGFELEPSCERGTYSYYMRSGDHLSIHRDVNSCELVVITCLHSAGKRDESSGALCLYPTRAQEPISAIRANPSLDILPIHLGVGQSIIMRGGVIPHALSPLHAGQFRIVSILCYQQKKWIRAKR